MRMNRSIYIPALLALLLPAGYCLAQTSVQDGSNPLSSRFKAYRASTFQEKLFAHTDKSFYIAGEILWFKLYNVEASSHQPVTISKVAYVDVLDSANRFVLQGKVALTNGEGKGSFFLPLTLNSGNYRLRAYTNWMKNFGPDLFFEEPLTIVNTLKGLPAATTDSTPRPSRITFFPEGGNLVKDIPTRVAFQLIDGEGRGQEGHGVIINENSDTLTSFHTLRSGIGSFSFTPAGNHTYRAVLLMPDGQPLVKELPAAFDRGMVMNVSEERDGRLRAAVHARGIGGDIYLFAQTRQMEKLVLKSSLNGDSAVFHVDRNALGEGITQLTLFDGMNRPICERLYFKRPAQPLHIDAETDQPQYGTRKKVQLKVGTGEGSGAQLPASLSLAVYRLDGQPAPPEMNIYNYLWLLSDLKGNIESPDTYFSTTGPEADQALDNLMLTHGWRRFKWDDILQDKPRTYSYPPELAGQIIAARLTDMKTGQPLIERAAFLSVPGVAYRFQSAQTDSTGRIFFDIKDFYGPNGFVLHSGIERDSPCKVEVLSPFSEQYSSRSLSDFPLSMARQQQVDWLEDRGVSMQVQNIYSGDSLQRYRAPQIDTLPFYGHPDYTYMLDDYTRFTTMEEVLREYVREINVNRAHGRLHVNMFDEPKREFFDDDNYLVLLDGVPVPADRIFAYDPLKVRKLEVIPREYFMGPSVFNGVASFTTYKGDYEGFELDPHSLLIDYEGLQLQREFYAPAYATEQQAASRQPDFRELLYWSPDIHTDGRSKQDYSFYTSDIPGKYVAVVQGMTGDGKAGAKYVYFEVK